MKVAPGGTFPRTSSTGLPTSTASSTAAGCRVGLHPEPWSLRYPHFKHSACVLFIGDQQIFVDPVHCSWNALKIFSDFVLCCQVISDPNPELMRIGRSRSSPRATAAAEKRRTKPEPRKWGALYSSALGSGDPSPSPGLVRVKCVVRYRCSLRTGFTAFRPAGHGYPRPGVHGDRWVDDHRCC